MGSGDRVRCVGQRGMEEQAWRAETSVIGCWCPNSVSHGFHVRDVLQAVCAGPVYGLPEVRSDGRKAPGAGVCGWVVEQACAAPGAAGGMDGR